MYLPIKRGPSKISKAFSFDVVMYKIINETIGNVLCKL